MSTKTKTFFVILITLLLGAVAGALTMGTIQHNKEARFSRMPRNERFHRAMERIIQPTPEQKVVLDKKLKERFDQIAALRERYENEIFAVYDSLNKDLDSVLTPEQQVRLQQELVRGPRKALDDRLAQMTRELNLTDEQTDRIRAIWEEMMPERPDFRRGERPDRNSIRARLEKMRAEVEAVLTPEQLEKYREMRDTFDRPFDRRRGPRRDQEPGPGPPMDGQFEEPPPHE